MDQLTAAIEAQAGPTKPFVIENAEGRDTPYDFFISHASADKDDFVDIRRIRGCIEPLAAK